MGAWGYGLFQSNAELDTMEEISAEAGKLASDPKFTFWYPDNKEELSPSSTPASSSSC